MVRLCDGRLVRLQDHLGAICVHVQGTQDQDETRECLRHGQEECVCEQTSLRRTTPPVKPLNRYNTSQLPIENVCTDVAVGTCTHHMDMYHTHYEQMLGLDMYNITS